MSYRGSHVVVGLLLVCSLFCSIICLMTADALAQASAPSKQKTNNAEEAAVFERILNRAHFENDGTEMSETEAVVRIQSQAGVEEFGQLVFGYSSATEKLEVEYVRVRKPDGHVVVTPESTAQDFAPDVQRLPAAAYFRCCAAARGHTGIPHRDSGPHTAGRGKLLVRVHISEGCS